MQNEILVAGYETADNPIMKMVVEYGFKAVHLPYNAPSQNLPNCRAAIVVTTNISHELMNRVKKEYTDRNRPVIYAKQGGSSIRDEFEQLLVSPIKQLIEPLNKKYQTLFLMTMFNKVGSKVYTGDIEDLAAIYGVEIATGYISVMFADWQDDGTLTKLTGLGSKGRYIFNGMSDIDAVTVQKKCNFNVPPTWKHKQVIKEPIMENQPVLQEGEKPKVPSIAPMVSADFEKRIEEMFAQHVAKTQHQIQTLIRAMDTVTHSFNPNTRESMLRDINEKLEKMSASELLRIKSMFDIWTK